MSWPLGSYFVSHGASSDAAIVSSTSVIPNANGNRPRQLTHEYAVRGGPIGTGVETAVSEGTSHGL